MVDAQRISGAERKSKTKKATKKRFQSPEKSVEVSTKKKTRMEAAHAYLKSIISKPSVRDTLPIRAEPLRVVVFEAEKARDIAEETTPQAERTDGALELFAEEESDVVSLQRRVGVTPSSETAAPSSIKAIEAEKEAKAGASNMGRATPNLSKLKPRSLLFL